MKLRRALALALSLATVLSATAVVGPFASYAAAPEMTPSCHQAAPPGPAITPPPPCDLPAGLCALACFGVPEIAATTTLHPPVNESARFDHQPFLLLNRVQEAPEPVPRDPRA